ncbi:MAG: pilus assembly protein [Phycisphaerae bacterium]|nr:pilus assembly protein [Phycisphaerae bacterium]
MMTRRAGPSWITAASGLLGLMVLCLYGMRFGGEAAAASGLIRAQSTVDVFFCFGLGAIGSAVALAAVLIDRMTARLQRPAHALGCERGVVLVELVLILPFLILIAGTVIQLMLILNASVVVRYAAFAAARVAAVGYDRDGIGPDELPAPGLERDIFETAVLVTATLAPSSGQGTTLNQAGEDPRNPGAGGNQASPTGETDPAATMLESVLTTDRGLYGARTVSIRHSYARRFTSVSFEDWVPSSPFEFSTMRNLYPAREVEVTVRFDFFLALHGFIFLPGLSEPMPSGLPGRTFPLGATVTMQTAGSRVHSPGAFFGGLPRP